MTGRLLNSRSPAELVERVGAFARTCDDPRKGDPEILGRTAGIAGIDPEHQAVPVDVRVGSESGRSWRRQRTAYDGRPDHRR
jgi:hypothetical protein